MGNQAENTVKDLVKTLVSVIEERDPYMKGHSERVARQIEKKEEKEVTPEKEAKNKLWDVKEISTGIQEVHTSFGGAILRKWGFSEEFARISLLHEGPGFRPETDKEILAVNLASNVAEKIGYGLADDEEVELQSLASARLLNIDSGIIDDLSEEAKELMQETANIF